MSIVLLAPEVTASLDRGFPGVTFYLNVLKLVVMPVDLFDFQPLKKYPEVDDLRIRKSNRPTPVPYGHKAYRVQCMSLSIDFICLASSAAHAEIFARNFVWDEFECECFLSVTEYNDFFVLK